MKLVKEALDFMIKNGGLEDYLYSLGVYEDVIEFIQQLPNNQKESYIKELRSNPALTLDQLRQVVESKVSLSPIDQAKQEFPGMHDHIEQLAQYDPSGNSYRYLKWMIKQIAKGHSYEDLIPTIQYFHNNQGNFPSRDINKYEDLKEVENIMKEVELSKQESSTAQKRKGKEGGVKLYEDDRYTFLRMDSKEACIQYGAGTKWCITMRDELHYERYKGLNVVFYYLLDKQMIKEIEDPKQANPKYKIAFAVVRDLHDNSIKRIIVFDAQDNQYDMKWAKQNIPIYSQIENIIGQNAPEQPKSILAKIKTGEATEEEADQYLSLFDGKELHEILKFFPKNNYKEIQGKYLDKLSNHSDVDIVRDIAYNPNTTPETLDKLSEHSNNLVVSDVARNPNTPKETLDKLSNHSDVDIVHKVARNPNTPPETLDKLSNHSDKYIVRDIAYNPNTPPETLDKLSNHSNILVVIDVVRNPNTAPETLDKLSDHSDNLVVMDIAYNPNTPPETLDKLSNHSDLGIVMGVAKNPSTPKNTLDKLSNHSNIGIVDIAKRKLEILEKDSGTSSSNKLLKLTEKFKYITSDTKKIMVVNNSEIDFIIKRGGLGDYLASLGVEEDVTKYILNLPNEQKQQYIQVVRQNPDVTIEQLNELAKQPSNLSFAQMSKRVKQASTTKIQKAMEAMDRKNKQVSIVDASRGNFNQEYDSSGVKKEVPAGMSRVNMDVRMIGRMGYIAKNHDYRNDGAQLGDNALNPGESIWHRLDQFKSLQKFLDQQGSYKQQENKLNEYVYTNGPKNISKMANKKNDKKRVDQNIRPYPNPVFRNFDYTSEEANETSPGGGFYHGPMDRHKSVKEFREKKRKELEKRKKKLESFNILMGFQKLSAKNE